MKERHLLTSTNLLLQVFQDHDPDNLLLRQAQDEMLADQLEFGRLLLCYSPCHREVVHCTLDKPSPWPFRTSSTDFARGSPPKHLKVA